MDIYDSVKYRDGVHIEEVLEPPLNIITLGLWGGTENPAPFPFHRKACHIFHMNTGTESCETPDECRYLAGKLDNKVTKWHGKKDCRYNFLIGGDLNVYEVRGLAAAPLLPNLYHKMYGRSAFLIGYMGEFTDISLPPPMWKVACRLVTYLAKSEVIDWNHVHHRLFDRPPLEMPKTREFGEPRIDPSQTKKFQ